MILVIIGSVFWKDGIRKKYPYCPKEYPQYGFHNMVRDYVTLPYIMGHDTAVFGKFLDVSEEIVEVGLTPDKASWQYRIYRDALEENPMQVLKYYKLSFQIYQDIYDDLGRNYEKKEIVDIYITNAVKFDTLPKIKKGSKFILFLDGVCPEGKEAFEWTDFRDCFYVSDWNRVYSYENVEALNEYSGKTVQYVSEEIRRFKEEQTPLSE